MPVRARTSHSAACRPESSEGGPGADYATRMTAILGHLPDAYAMYAYETTVVVIQAIDKVGEKDRAQDSGRDVRDQGLLGSARHYLVASPRRATPIPPTCGLRPDPRTAQIVLSEGDADNAYSRGDVEGRVI